MPRQRLLRGTEGKDNQFNQQRQRTFVRPNEPRADAYKKRLREMPRDQRPTMANCALSRGGPEVMEVEIENDVVFCTYSNYFLRL
jgi:hypothetical protein